MISKVISYFLFDQFFEFAKKTNAVPLALSWRRSLLYRNQSIDLQSK